jgi:hypothetical protein
MGVTKMEITNISDTENRRCKNCLTVAIKTIYLDKSIQKAYNMLTWRKIDENVCKP